MDRSIISAEQIAFALRQADEGVPLRIITESLSIDEDTFRKWKRRYFELFQSIVLGHQGVEGRRAYVLHCEYDSVVETELRECKIHHTRVRDVAATVHELLRNGKKLGFFDGPFRFNVQEFGAPTLLDDKASVSIQDTVDPRSPDQVTERRVQIKIASQPLDEAESAFLVVSAESGRFLTTDRSCDEPCQSYTPREEVDSLFGIRLDMVGIEHDRVRLWEGPLIVSMQAIARDPKDAIRTFFTTDLDVMLMGNYLLEK